MNADTGKINERAFRERAAQAVQAALPDGWTLAATDDPLLIVAHRPDGDDQQRITLHLDNFYATYCQPGTRLSGVLDAITTVIQAQLRVQTDDHAWPAAAPKLRLQLNPAGVIGEQVPWQAGLVLRVVLDEPDVIQVVTPELLTIWAQTRDAVVEQARTQTHTMLAVTGATTVRHGAMRVWMWEEPVGYAATRLIVPDLIRRDVGHADDLIVVAPGRDLLLAVPTDTPAELLALLIIAALQRQAYRLAPERLFVLSGTTIEPMDASVT